jgi:hypothetical protein
MLKRFTSPRHFDATAADALARVFTRPAQILRFFPPDRPQASYRQRLIVNSFRRRIRNYNAAIDDSIPAEKCLVRRKNPLKFGYVASLKTYSKDSLTDIKNNVDMQNLVFKIKSRL